MILIEETQISADVLPLDQFKAHLRLGTGFAEDRLQDQMLEGYLRAAISSIEGRTGQALFMRDFRWILDEWSTGSRQVFPVSPVRMVQTLEIIARDDTRTFLDPQGFRIEEDSLHPALSAIEGDLPELPPGGKIEVRLRAGAATNWDGVPPDLAQAVMLLSAHYYEYRNELTLSRGCTPFGVTALLERYRPMRLSMRSAQ